MAQRKGQSKQRRRRRRARRDGTPTVLILLCLLLTVVAIILAATLFFKIETITLTGDTRYNRDYVAQASGLEIGDNLVLFDKISVKNGIYEVCPYLDTVQILRRYPSGIEIIVTECEPVAVICDEKTEIPDPEDDSKTITTGLTGCWLMDRNGKLLENIPSTRNPELTRIYGVTLVSPKEGESVEILQEDTKKPLFLLLNTAEDDGILQDIGGMDFAEPYAIRFNYLGRFVVKVGSTEDLDVKMRYLHLIVEEKLSSNAAGTLDLSDVQTARFIPNN
ncbi:MAG: FtsQ-type POTRA domain-containing protein [Clostridia bacterium]|nr:FtsQ-type POTRA domain-containing protein [Clostridia bacterium]